MNSVVIYSDDLFFALAFAPQDKFQPDHENAPCPRQRCATHLSQHLAFSFINSCMQLRTNLEFPRQWLRSANTYPVDYTW